MTTKKRKINFKPTYKQHEAWKYLEDSKTTEIYYGGAAGGGKTYLACAWLTKSCLQYPGTRWFIGRDSVKSIWQSTFNTLVDIWNSWGFKVGTGQGGEEVEIKINYKDGIIRFFNGSEIYFLDLHENPTDPEFQRLGSMEFTGGFLEEVAQISRRGKEIVRTRIRYKLEDYGLIPKLLIASNPTKNWVYNEFFHPWKRGELPEHKVFIQAFVKDNPYISPHYLKSLENLESIDRERLLEGNFEYDDNLAKLFNLDCINNSFSNTYVQEGKKYISCDVARKGSDKAVIIVWSGFRAEKIISMDISLLTQIKNTILSMAEKYSVPRSNIVIDEDGVGGGLVDELGSVRGFVNNSQPFNKENYQNLKAQCYFKLAEKINNNEIFINAEQEPKDKIMEELEQIEQKDQDKDGKLALVGKDIIKQNIGRSPDYADALMMRMYFEMEPRVSFAFV